MPRIPGPSAAPAALRRRWRWAPVTALVAALVALPSLVGAWPVDVPPVPPTELRARVLASADVAYVGHAESRGRVRLPQIRFLGEGLDLLASRTRLRAWVAGEDRWRVDRLLRGGEVGTYRDGDERVSWVSADRRLVREAVSDIDRLRLARPDDLLPPALGRRFLAAAADHELVTLPPRRVAGHEAVGVRVRPTDPRTTVATVDVWADPTTGLALAVEVRAERAKAVVLSSTFLELDLRAPADDLLAVPGRATFPEITAPTSDLYTAARDLGVVTLPATLAGMARQPGIGEGGIGVYGTGYATATVLALPSYLGSQALAPVRERTRPWGGRARVLTTPLLGLVAAEDGPVTFVLVGTVSLAQLEAMTEELVERA